MNLDPGYVLYVPDNPWAARAVEMVASAWMAPVLSACLVLAAVAAAAWHIHRGTDESMWRLGLVVPPMLGLLAVFCAWSFGSSLVEMEGEHMAAGATPVAYNSPSGERTLCWITSGALTDCTVSQHLRPSLLWDEGEHFESLAGVLHELDREGR